MGLIELFKNLFKNTPDKELKQIVNYCIKTLEGMSDEQIVVQRDAIKKPAQIYITDCIAELLKRRGKVDLDSILKISRFLNKEDDVSNFNIKFNIIKKMINAQGFSTVQNRSVLNCIVTELLDSFWECIAKKAKIDPLKLLGDVE